MRAADGYSEDDEAEWLLAGLRGEDDDEYRPRPICRSTRQEAEDEYDDEDDFNRSDNL